jgi:DMSO/TMAO reductase YedYZ molybdopterin-dependent catalytic subunit
MPFAGGRAGETTGAASGGPGDGMAGDAAVPGERPAAGQPQAEARATSESPADGSAPAERTTLAAGTTADGSAVSSANHGGGDSEDGTGGQPTDDDAFGFPAGLWRKLAAHRPPGLPTPNVWRSPLRGPWLTSVLGFLLLISLPLVIVTGLLDWIAYGPQFHQAIPAHVGFLHLPYFDWPNRPAWLFQLTEGLHVGLGLVLVPVVLAKLWSVMPKLFAWPPVRSVANLLERISLIMIVGGIVFEMVTGILNIQYDYIFGFSFYTAHYFGAWVFITGFVVHVSLKLPTMVRSLRSRSLRAELHTSLADTRPEPLDPDGLVASSPSEPTLSRRGVLAVVGGGSLMIAVLTVGQTLGGVARNAALLVPRGRSYGDGPNDFQINRTAVAASIVPGETGASWQLALSGGARSVFVSRASLLAMEQHAAELPIACVEGWATTQHWSGVRLADLASLAGVPAPSAAHVKSLEKGGGFGEAWLQSNQVLAPDALLALKVNGADLSLDHGFPARVIIPALPGVHCTKWVRSIEFMA